MPLFYDVFMRWPLPVICLSSLAASSIFWSLHMQRTPQSRIIGYIGSLNLPAQKDMTWASRHASPLCNAECPRHKARQWPEARHQQWHSAGSRWSENTLKRSSHISEKKEKARAVNSEKCRTLCTTFCTIPGRNKRASTDWISSVKLGLKCPWQQVESCQHIQPLAMSFPAVPVANTWKQQLLTWLLYNYSVVAAKETSIGTLQ